MRKRHRLAALLACLTLAALATADTKLGTVEGILIGHGDTGTECCKHLTPNHTKPGSSTDMNKLCYAMHGHVVKNIRQDGGSYCRPRQKSGGGYKYSCDAVAVGDCYRFD